MLRISKKLDYALVVLVYLARSRGRKLLSARDISSLFQLPLPITAAILKVLARAGIIESIRGARGGYTLTHTPESVTLAMIVEAVEGPLNLADCVGGAPVRRKRKCLLSARCPMTHPIRRLHEAVFSILAGVTLAQLAHDAAPLPDLSAAESASPRPARSRSAKRR